MSATPENKHLRHMETLRRRANHLQSRVAGDQKLSLSYDRRELAALLWVLELIAPEPQAATEQEPTGEN